MTDSLFGYQTKNHGTLFLLCWAAYFSTYLCRLNYSAVMPELSGGNVFSSAQIASVSSVFFICYGAGQLLSGILGDRLDTRRMIFGGLFISSISNILIFFFHSFPVLLFLWAVNGIVQSLVWSPILKIASIYFNKADKEKFSVDISTTVPLGTLASYGISLLTVAFLPWNFVFLTCGLTELVFAAVWLLGTKKLLLRMQPPSDSPVPLDRQNVLSFKATFKLIVSSGVLLMLISIAIQGTLKDSVTQWVPTFFNSAFGSKTTFSLALTMTLPIVNVTGAYFAKALNKRLQNEVMTSAVFFGISTLFLLVLRLFGSQSIALALVSMAGVTNCMFAINVMLITMVPLWFHKSGRVSTIGGFLNALAYIGCGGLNLLAGKILDSGAGWNHLFILWIALAVLAAVVSLLCVPMWRRYIKSVE